METATTRSCGSLQVHGLASCDGTVVRKGTLGTSLRSSRATTRRACSVKYASNAQRYEMLRSSRPGMTRLRMHSIAQHCTGKCDPRPQRPRESRLRTLMKLCIRSASRGAASQQRPGQVLSIVAKIAKRSTGMAWKISSRCIVKLTTFTP